MAGEEQIDTKYLPELMAEKDSIDPSFVHALRLISTEIEKIKNPPQNEKEDSVATEKDMINICDMKHPKVSCMIKVPVDEYPNINFVGRLIGPGGATLKGIQEITSTRIGILGKGSMRDKKKAEELASGGDAKYQHLNLPLHVKITAIAPVDQAHLNIGRACAEVLKLLQVEDDEYMDPAMGRGRGMGQRGGSAGRGIMRSRGGSGRGSGGVSGRSATSGASTRGNQRVGSAARGRGTSGGNRGYSSKQVQLDPYAAQVDEYGYEYAAEAYEGYGAEYADATYDAYGGDAYADPYAADGSYGADAGYAGDAYAYGDGSYGGYGNGSADVAGGGQYSGGKPFRGKMRGSSGRGRGSSKPY